MDEFEALCARLDRLKRYRDEGVVSEEEFVVLKRRYFSEHLGSPETDASHERGRDDASISSTPSRFAPEVQPVRSVQSLGRGTDMAFQPDAARESDDQNDGRRIQGTEMALEQTGQNTQPEAVQQAGGREAGVESAMAQEDLHAQAAQGVDTHTQGSRPAARTRYAKTKTPLPVVTS